MPKGIYIRTKPKTEKWKIKMKEVMTGNRHFAWKGDNVGYYALHAWVIRRLGKPNKCDHCGETGLSGHKIHWANINHQYKRNLNDWVRLCVRCHQNYDIENFGMVRGNPEKGGRANKKYHFKKK